MEIRSVTGATIADALSEARSLWGDTVVMMQAEPHTDGSTARIAVAVPSAITTQTSPVEVMVQERPLPPPAFPAGPLPGALRRTSRSTGLLLDQHIRPAEEVFTRVDRQGQDLPARPVEDTPSQPQPGPGHASESGSREHGSESIQGQELDPLFMRLVRQGLRPHRAKSVAEVGENSGSAASVEKLASYLPPPVAGRAPSRVIFAGDSGSGKTSLVLRSALSRVRAGRRTPTIVVVSPRQTEMRGWQDPTSMFEDFDFEVVRCSGEALPSALEAIRGDVLVDTPPGFEIPSKLRLHTRLVVDARSAGSATAREGRYADSVVVTHVDGAAMLGYVTERIIAMSIPVAAMVRGSRPERGIEAYTPTKLAQAVCDV
jgi:hypothetical protein